MCVKTRTWNANERRTGVHHHRHRRHRRHRRRRRRRHHHLLNIIINITAQAGCHIPRPGVLELEFRLSEDRCERPRLLDRDRRRQRGRGGGGQASQLGESGVLRSTQRPPHIIKESACDHEIGALPVRAAAAATATTTNNNSKNQVCVCGSCLFSTAVTRCGADTRAALRRRKEVARIAHQIDQLDERVVPPPDGQLSPRYFDQQRDTCRQFKLRLLVPQPVLSQLWASTVEERAAGVSSSTALYTHRHAHIHTRSSKVAARRPVGVLLLRHRVHLPAVVGTDDDDGGRFEPKCVQLVEHLTAVERQ